MYKVKKQRSQTNMLGKTYGACIDDWRMKSKNAGRKIKGNFCNLSGYSNEIGSNYSFDPRCSATTLVDRVSLHSCTKMYHNFK